MKNFKHEYLFEAHAKNGNIIRQTPDDTSRLNKNKSAFYDVLQNLPLKTFSLVGKGHVFTIDFENFRIVIDGGINQAPIPPIGSKVTPIYYHDTIQVAKSTVALEETLVTHIKKLFVETKHHATITARYVIGFQVRKPDGKNVEFKMEIK